MGAFQDVVNKLPLTHVTVGEKHVSVPDSGMLLVISGLLIFGHPQQIMKNSATSFFGYPCVSSLSRGLVITSDGHMNPGLCCMNFQKE